MLPKVGSVTLLPLEKMGPDVRSLECPHCGQRHDRDVNAAINIRNKGLRLLALGTGATQPQTHLCSPPAKVFSYVFSYKVTPFSPAFLSKLSGIIQGVSGSPAPLLCPVSLLE
ncbi:transposase [Synechococcus bigranulatus str. 'Rupite']|uniref:Transposase n=1 Tax=Thermostichus vulcanus str. 'Rupite' TaxID=2813851 RepID=A0ABT0CFL3_THEVL|nr:transposase [Thermostichus vulcanus str. 'Rupite']